MSAKARRCKDQKAQRQEARTEGGPKRKGVPKKARSRSEEDPKKVRRRPELPTELLVLLLRSIKFGNVAVAWVPRSIKFRFGGSTDDDPEKSARPTWARSRAKVATKVLASCVGGPCGGSSPSLSIVA